MAFDWGWSDLLSGLVGLIIGWLGKVLHGKQAP
jgi:hypothetical protein